MKGINLRLLEVRGLRLEAKKLKAWKKRNKGYGLRDWSLKR
jgi:hypothetical protein